MGKADGKSGWERIPDWNAEANGQGLPVGQKPYAIQGCLLPFGMFLSVIPESNDRLGSRYWVVRITSGILPQQLTSFISQFPGEGVIEPDKPALNELL